MTAAEDELTIRRVAAAYRATRAIPLEVLETLTTNGVREIRRFKRTNLVGDFYELSTPIDLEMKIEKGTTT